jgi:hypothetical protein
MADPKIRSKGTRMPAAWVLGEADPGTPAEGVAPGVEEDRWEVLASREQQTWPGEEVAPGEVVDACVADPDVVVDHPTTCGSSRSRGCRWMATVSHHHISHRYDGCGCACCHCRCHNWSPGCHQTSLCLQEGAPEE